MAGKRNGQKEGKEEREEEIEHRMEDALYTYDYQHDIKPDNSHPVVTVFVLLDNRSRAGYRLRDAGRCAEWV